MQNNKNYLFRGGIIFALYYILACALNILWYVFHNPFVGEPVNLFYIFLIGLTFPVQPVFYLAFIFSYVGGYIALACLLVIFLIVFTLIGIFFGWLYGKIKNRRLPQ